MQITDITEYITPTCSVCRMIAPALDKFLNEEAPAAKFTRLDATDPTNAELVKSANVKQAPTFVVHTADGQEHVFTGGGSIMQLKKLVSQ